MCKVEVSVDRIRDSRGRCVGSRLEVASVDGAEDHNEILFQVAADLTEAQGTRRGKLFLAVELTDVTSSLVRAASAMRRELRGEVVIEATTRGGEIGDHQGRLMRNLRTTLGFPIALRSDVADQEGFLRGIRRMDPEFVIVDSRTSAWMVTRKDRSFLLDVVEQCAPRGARVMMQTEAQGQERDWLIAGGTEMTVQDRFHVQMDCDLYRGRETSRSVDGTSAGKPYATLDGLLTSLGVEKALKVE